MKFDRHNAARHAQPITPRHRVPELEATTELPEIIQESPARTLTLLPIVRTLNDLVECCLPEWPLPEITSRQCRTQEALEAGDEGVAATSALATWQSIIVAWQQQSESISHQISEAEKRLKKLSGRRKFVQGWKTLNFDQDRLGTRKVALTALITECQSVVLDLGPSIATPTSNSLTTIDGLKSAADEPGKSVLTQLQEQRTDRVSRRSRVAENCEQVRSRSKDFLADVEVLRLLPRQRDLADYLTRTKNSSVGRPIVQRLCQVIAVGREEARKESFRQSFPERAEISAKIVPQGVVAIDSRKTVTEIRKIGDTDKGEDNSTDAKYHPTRDRRGTIEQSYRLTGWTTVRAWSTWLLAYQISQVLEIAKPRVPRRARRAAQFGPLRPELQARVDEARVITNRATNRLLQQVACRLERPFAYDFEPRFLDASADTPAVAQLVYASPEIDKIMHNGGSLVTGLLQWTSQSSHSRRCRGIFGHAIASLPAGLHPTEKQGALLGLRLAAAVGVEHGRHGVAVIAHHDSMCWHIHVVWTRIRSDGAVLTTPSIYRDRACHLVSAIATVMAIGETVVDALGGFSKSCWRADQAMHRGDMFAELQEESDEISRVPLQGPRAAARIAALGFSDGEIPGGISKVVGYWGSETLRKDGQSIEAYLFRQERTVA